MQQETSCLYSVAFVFVFEGMLREETGPPTCNSAVIGMYTFKHLNILMHINIYTYIYIHIFEHMPGFSMKSMQVFVNEAPSSPEEYCTRPG